MRHTRYSVIEDIVLEYMAALGAHDFATCASYLTDDFTFTGLMSEPLGRTEFLALEQAFYRAMPDCSYFVSNVEAEDEIVRATVQRKGTHTGELTLPISSLPSIPATGKTLYLPAEPFEYGIDKDKIMYIEVWPVPGGGIEGLLSQLGITLPPS